MTTKRISTGFVHLHVRSEHSHLYGASRLDELIPAALALGYKELALTDRGGMYGAVAFYLKAREAGLKPILGVELEQPVSPAAPAAGSNAAGSNAAGANAPGGMPPRGGYIVLLARNLEGYRTLCRLTTARHLNPDFDLAEAVAADHEAIYVLVPDAALLARLDGRVPRGRLFALLDEFGDRSTRLRNDGLARAAAKRRLPLAGGGAVAFHVPGRFAAHRALRAIATLTTVADVPRRELAHPKAWLKGPEEMAALFRACPEAAINTIRIAADCNLELPLGRPIFPKARLPEGETPYSHLAKLAFAGLKERYRPLRPEAVRRLETELAVIDRLGFADYFLIMHEIAAWTRGRGIPCVARGSAAGSLVTYCLGLSGVDPLRYGLLFERFLNLERADCPDIDLDVCWRSRDDVIRHVYETHGAARVAMISTHQTFQARSAFREVAKAHGLAPGEVDDLARRLPYFSAAGIRDAVLEFPECRDFPVDRPDIARILEIAAAIDGLPRHLSVHVGGLVIADRPLTDYAPLQVATKGIVITQYEADAVEALGLVKMDLLAQRSLSILQTAVKEIEKNHGLRVDPLAIEDGDPAVAAMLERGDTFGCFQIESPGMRNLLKMMGARRRMDVILGLSLIRPGPASSGMKERFVRRRRGLEPPEVLHPALGEVLGDTYGVMLYQEDVIRVAHAAAGFTLAEGDRLRKELAKGATPDQLETWRARFIRGAIAGGARREDAETLWERLTQFAAYSYCKAHACTYGEISYRAVYLRAHWPAEFAAAVLANQAGYYERRVYLEDARRHGCPILGPDVNASGIEPATDWLVPQRYFDWCAVGLSPRTNQQVSAVVLAGGPDRRVGVRLGLMDVRGLTERAMRQIVASREKDGPYRSAADLLARVRLSREEAENLALAGTLDSLAANRPAALWQVHAALSAPCPRGPLFEGACDPAEAPAGPDLADYSPLQKLLLEEHLLGMTPSANPMAIYRPLVSAECPPRRVNSVRNAEWTTNDSKEQKASPPSLGPAALDGRERREVLPIADLSSHAGEQAAVAGILFAERRARTKNGEFMKFISLEDETGVVEAVLLPDAYQRLGGRLTTRGPYVATGSVENHLGAISLIVTDLRLIPPAGKREAPSPTPVNI
jgi:DNA-directed DNA polymerase III PolC